MTTPKRKGKHRRIISIAAIAGVVVAAGLLCFGLCPQRAKADLSAPIRFDASWEWAVDNIEIYKDGRLHSRVCVDMWSSGYTGVAFTSGEVITVKFFLRNERDNRGIVYECVLPDGSTFATFEDLTIPREWSDARYHHLYWDTLQGVVEWRE